MTVTQAGSNYVATPFALTPLTPASTNAVRRIQIDGSGNIYWLSYASEVFEWVSASNQIIQVAQAVTDGYNLAVDPAGNAYFVSYNGYTVTILKWVAASNQVVTFFS